MTQILIDQDVRIEHGLDPHAVIWVGERDPRWYETRREEDGKVRVSTHRTLTDGWPNADEGE